MSSTGAGCVLNTTMIRAAAANTSTNVAIPTPQRERRCRHTSNVSSNNKTHEATHQPPMTSKGESGMISPGQRRMAIVDW